MPVKLPFYPHNFGKITLDPLGGIILLLFRCSAPVQAESSSMDRILQSRPLFYGNNKKFIMRILMHVTWEITNFELGTY